MKLFLFALVAFCSMSCTKSPKITQQDVTNARLEGIQQGHDNCKALTEDITDLARANNQLKNALRQCKEKLAKPVECPECIKYDK